MDLPKDIENAKTFFEKAESERDPKLKMIYLNDAIDTIESASDEIHSTEADLLNFISNLKKSHTRRLVSQLVSMSDIDIALWVEYIALLFARLKNEVEIVTKNDSNLKQNFDDFYQIWDKEFSAAIKLYESSVKK